MSIIDRYKAGIARIVSEPDSGVYHAITKGIVLATGDVIGTLNADDFFAHGEVLAKVAEVFEDPAVDSCYGDLDYVDPADPARVVRRWRSGAYDVRRFYWGWMPPHFFVRPRIYEKYGGFKPSFGTAADYELMVRLLVKHKISSVYIPAILVKMRTGGLSNISWMNRLRANRMDRKAWHENGLKPLPFTHILKPLSKAGQYVIPGSGC
jgi:glycosyltransferase involved in cell wall biosynthesis